MADMISSIPDDILLYILSFLPTKQVVATTVLSKRWNLLFRSVPSFDFSYRMDYDKNHIEDCYHFFHSVFSFLLSRDSNRSLHKFRLRCGSTFLMNTVGIKTSISTWIEEWIEYAVTGRNRVQHLDLNLDQKIVMPSMVFRCKTLVVLKLGYVTVKDISCVDLPLLKILHLNTVLFSEDVGLSLLLSGSPNVEDLEVKNINFDPSKVKFNRLPKLVRVRTLGHLFPLEIVQNVEDLIIYPLCPLKLGFDLENLVQLEINFVYRKEWLEVLEVLRHCPKLQNLVLGIFKSYRFELFQKNDEGAVLPGLQPIPQCISMYLKTCDFGIYEGSIDEIQFARYILQNAKYLRTMKIQICPESNVTDDKILYMIKELSSCMKSSNTCTLSIK
ncbi:hypothetical protein DEO72_LG5g3290 [Vigna unguiculata]|uniref:F-box domain-containing protein n=1 Tax=Vigna unguiculata TaxID=3917 RepID=A0A4D6M2Y4_VIGUN|nr:hypothetical protein DEO72_LG5g3290 [Vigna unguiculata]